MARAVIQLAAIATCVVLSLTAEDRQARSGDLDRGPPYGREVQRVNLFRGEGLAYSFNVGESDLEGIDGDIIHPPSEGIVQGRDHGPSKNYNNPQQKSDFREANFRLPIDYQKPYFVARTPLSEVESIESVETRIKTDSGSESENLSESRKSSIEFSDYNLDTLNTNRHLKPAELSNENNQQILSQLQNLRFKLPFRENASPRPLEAMNRSSLDPKNNQDDLNAFGHNNIISRSPSEITFGEADEEAMALRRRFEMSTEFFLVPSSSTPAPTSTASVHVTKSVYSGEADKIGGVFRNEVWVVPVLALSAITMVLIAGFEIFVLCKAWRTIPSRRHLFLGQMLLLGLFSCAGLASVFAASPTQLTCALMRFGTGVAYAIVFASLLVKCVFLISLNGGVYLPAPYQGLLLLFAILIQVAIGVQWLLTSPPIVDAVTVEHVVHQTRNRLLVTAADISTTQVIPLCRTPYVDMLLSLIYVIFLIIFVTVLAVKSRGIRDNYREATYIGLSVGCSIPTWLIWTISGLIVNERHRDACIAFGLVITSIMVFLIMFMPKGRQLAAMGKEGVYIEDREERFSSLSRAGSGYSPSFFHFKPIKYGMNHGTKHQPIATLRAGGKFIIIK